jgi:TolA-binding protein
MRRFAEPRLMMTAAMAFFSIALTISMTGVKISSVRMADLRPTSVRNFLEKRIMTASTPVIRYYDHLRFVYEVESRMRELRRTTESEQQNQLQNQQKSAQPSPQGGEGESHRKDGGSQLAPQKMDPNQAPQQTGNPHSGPAAGLWGDDMIEAEFRLDPRSKGFPIPASESIETSGLAMPERSSICIA